MGPAELLPLKVTSGPELGDMPTSYCGWLFPAPRDSRCLLGKERAGMLTGRSWALSEAAPAPECHQQWAQAVSPGTALPAVFSSSLDGPT